VPRALRHLALGKKTLDHSDLQHFYAYRLAHLAHGLGVSCALLSNFPEYLGLQGRAAVGDPPRCVPRQGGVPEGSGRQHRVRVLGATAARACHRVDSSSSSQGIALICCGPFGASVAWSARFCRMNQKSSEMHRKTDAKAGPSLVCTLPATTAITSRRLPAQAMFKFSMKCRLIQGITDGKADDLMTLCIFCERFSDGVRRCVNQVGASLELCFFAAREQTTS